MTISSASSSAENKLKEFNKLKIINNVIFFIFTPKFNISDFNFTDKTYEV